DWFFGSADIDVYTHALLDTYVINNQGTPADFSTTLITPFTGNQRSPSLSFDKYWDNMLMLYTHGNALIYQYCYMDNLFPTPGWAIFPNFRDATTNITWDPRTSLDINPTIAQVCMSWTEQDLDATQNVVFDAEWSTVGIDNPGRNNSLPVSVYPNPASEVVFLKIQEEGSFDLSVTDLNGREVIFEKVKCGENAIDISGLTPGMYIAKITGGKEPVSVKMSVK
ncbi:MAG: T9SS type A sorting domain-containing protein, partial [Bacteroidetes bacterium]|nr:T9SS type A sorting domain-containing protein [Bacteroidota bacterium]